VTFAEFRAVHPYFMLVGGGPLDGRVLATSGYDSWPDKIKMVTPRGVCSYAMRVGNLVCYDFEGLELDESARRRWAWFE